MKYSELKVGQTIKANALSNGHYSITSQRNNCVGKVKRIKDYAEEFIIEITEHDSDSRIGQTYAVEPLYFDLVEDIKGIKVELPEEVKEDKTIKVGDLLVTNENITILVVNDDDGVDYRGVVLSQEKTTSHESSLENLKVAIEKAYGEIKRVIPKENFKVVVSA